MKSSGFSLIELMIVIVIMAILSAIAYPSYQDSIYKSRRADAKSDLVEIASFLERYFTENNSYIVAALPDSITSEYYIYSSAANTFSFVLTATSIGTQTSDPCGNLTLTHTGVKGADISDCW